MYTVLPLVALLAFERASAMYLKMDDYLEERAKLIRNEQELVIGGKLILSEAEEKANLGLMKAKFQEVDKGFENASDFNPAQHFFLRKTNIEQSPVFKFIKKMPKGAVLHAHDTALIGPDFLVNKISYMDNLYIGTLGDNIQLMFSKQTPTVDGRKWELLSDKRKMSNDTELFDADLRKHFTLWVDDPLKEHPNVDVAWQHFALIFEAITPMLTYKPVWEMYFYEALRQFREDGVFYLEVRSVLPELYDLEGNKYDSVACAKAYRDVNLRFRQDYPDSFGARLIYAPHRLLNKPAEVEDYIDICKRLKNELGDFFAGFDLVGQEDKGRPLVDYVKELLNIGDIQVFYHAGETNWYGTPTDNNVIDAVLLGAKRIGHGYAMFKHPLIADQIMKKGVAIEVNPISNQVLKLVDDIRNHPASLLIANGYPMVISSDDPGLWEALPISHDIYTAFIGLSSREADLKFLKQLMINTLDYSAMPARDKFFALSKFKELWDVFINEINITSFFQTK